ncbi:RNA-binding transcriptional accessory protein [Corynebacterium sp. HMSC061H03]|uniref:Tex family protein n=1 Tax=Corynebacterium TaxID=1716 RepID=UPI0008A1A0BD|nr:MULTISPECIES: Tex family protein [unclassified Corynebacterium]OFK30920.1 RNA-binding transcriptional accessory protein [Corynebacterium sp. HMSC064E08]OFM49350.1 RNA-binding transcriptional accessory protein [Corynebacterium sp. HMSC064H12]OFQ01248.1 RNA-binding transcriptional accessory protein [Corynebacterium sp. HMSC070B05]OHR21841.1 RNA-binding transcriptional accessory protein [Corynebacterium sp. HMSC061H03]
MISSVIARELAATGADVAESAVAAAIKLLDEGNTVPFIARYRKEVTGGLDDTQLRFIEERVVYLRELEERKQTILAAIEEQGKLNDDLKAAILACDTKARLEDLYLPYKKKRKTKADIAREAGYEPLVEELLADPAADPETLATKYGEAAGKDAKDALTGARAILVDRFATDADLVGSVREQVWSSGSAAAAVVEGKETAGAKYRDYFEHNEPLDTMPSHRVLAVLRGEAEGILTLNIDAGEDETYEHMIREAFELPDGGASKWIDQAVRFGWRTKLEVSAALDARTRLKERAEAEAVDVFARNLRDLLLAAPAGQRATLGLDPGYRNGVKCAVVDSTGKVLDTAIVYPHQPRNDWSGAKEQLATLCATHRVELMAIGNGTASRETETLAREIADLIAQAGGKKPTPVVVSEAGASVYSASSLAAAEFPDMDVSLRGAVSIARRLQDPLAELVKIDPKSIGVGQYQHDVSQTKLEHSLDAVVEDAVNAVGVEVNTASAPLLGRVAGVSSTVADNIVAYRDENGAFTSRKELLKVPRLGPKAFEQCAGFLRIHGANNPLDASAVHPESYRVVDAIAASTGVSVQELIGNSRVLSKVRAADFVDESAGIGLPTVQDILTELDKPGRDPRPEFVTATFKEGVEKVSDLQPGMILEGTVTNVAAFGAFVDVGVHQDGLVHVSNMARGFVSDPHEVVRSGEVVKVKVLDVDVERNRIGLSLRLDDDASDTKPKRDGGRGEGRGGGRKRGSQNKKRGGANRGGGGGSMADALRRAGF